MPENTYDQTAIMAQFRISISSNAYWFNSTAAHHGLSQFHEAYYYALPQEFIEELKAKGANPTIRDKYGRLPEDYEDIEKIPGLKLFAAIRSKNVEKVRQVIAEQPELINKKDVVEDTPLHVAAMLGLNEICEELLDKGADPNIRSFHGLTPAQMASNIETSEAIVGRQIKLIPKMNAYLLSQGKEPISTAGYCNGLACFYLYAKAQGKQAEFFHNVRLVIRRKTGDESQDSAIAEFIEKVRRLQSPGTFDETIGQNQLQHSINLIKKVDQPSIQHEWNFAFSFQETELWHLIERLSENKMLLISSLDHAVAIYKASHPLGKGGASFYYMYDANTTGDAEILDLGARNVTMWIGNVMGSLFPHPQHVSPEAHRFLPLSINVFDLEGNAPGQYPNSKDLVKEYSAGVPINDRKAAPKWGDATSLHSAISQKNEVLVNTLLDNNADPNAKAIIHENSLSPLELALRYNHLGIARSLLEHGADANANYADGTNFLVGAILMKSKPMVDLLLAHGADPLKMTNGKTALDAAIDMELDREIPKALLKASHAQFTAAVYLTALTRALSYRDFGLGWEVVKAGFNALVAPLFNRAPSTAAAPKALCTPLLADHKAKQEAAAGTGLKLDPPSPID
ncbi:MAG: tankyrase [Gammaproteobacteria bacterium]|nr:tankyrase [Gammaproteobacteria bacterium]